MNKKLTKALQNIGMDDKEAEVYLACLELESASNAQIAQKTKLNRITNYEVLKRLQYRGIVKSFRKRKVMHFLAIDPRIILKRAKERVQDAEESLPELLAISNQMKKKPKVMFFDGLEGIKSLYEDSLTTKKEILTFTNAQDLHGILEKFMDKYVDERVKKKIPLRGIAPDDKFGKKAKMNAQESLRQARLFSKEKYMIHNEILIYDDKVALYSAEDEIGLLIESKSISQTFSTLWNMVWDNIEE
ncbi:MAG: hypothetical protein COV59_00480 [Candidatus Magasanikbacteria bacterium CG11_big_fil_rev_8_21_14_0_20_39_34]|uniref:Transcription regulator TrmB N-terminal domain-containing protein n=1 Tax=Candidatus Magasanikbacteria bacterium CG11_big_fil_rev_8_21_14_0_20_39_34 TaxID=1974653 RepID=A0A2H0N6T9_9BACT|nr:MAG: hypothetical protein COV59_00480 [Candidatus Magasanikbacteria bacterium CG11_big_fil_rev_8_21_14_0_20_39_34]